MKKLDLKVCGLTLADQVTALADSAVKYGGFIFYPPSSRYVEGKIDPNWVKTVKDMKKVGVFVNAQPEHILSKATEYGLDYVQLHGEEAPDYCKTLRKKINVIKAFKVRDKEDILKANTYAGSCDYFLFDTAGKLYGGNGQLFNWELLNHYQSDTPFFLSGGIGLEQVADLKEFNHPQLVALDVNSKFEDAPGDKNIPKITQFITDLELV